MQATLRRIVGFSRELRRRRVFRGLATYAVGAWLLVEVASVFLSAFEAPAFVLRALIAVVVLGLPVAALLSWMYDFTATGVVRTDDVAAAEEPVGLPAVADQTGRDTHTLRKRMTVLCAAVDIADAGGGVTDPEDLLELQPQAMELCRKVCERFGGNIVPGRGGEVVAYFGHPVVREDDASRAVRTGLGIVEGIERLDASAGQASGLRLHARVGVHTDEVLAEVSDDDASTTPGIVGLLPGSAAALMERCAPGQLLVTEDTWQMVRDRYEGDSLGEARVAPGGAPLRLHRVLNESTARSRVDRGAESGLPPLRGRDQELALLQKRWEQALSGHGQVAMITGESGIGKSRVVHRIKEMAAENPEAWLGEMYCSPLHQNTALYPVAEFFRREVLRAGDSGTPERQLATLEGLLAEYNQNLAETVPLMASLLDVPPAGKYAPLPSSPQHQRQAVMELLVDMLLQRSARQPVLFVVEDLHWADPTTIDLVSRLIERTPGHDILCVLSFRPSLEPPWSLRSHVSQVNLEGLDPESAAALCRGSAPDVVLPQELVDRIIDQADGVPLYVEEMTKMIVESGALAGAPDAQQIRQLTETIIPATLQDALTARLDRLGRARTVASIGSAIGRDFSHELILDVGARVEARAVEESLLRLVQAEILFRRGKPPQASYRFKHALIQEAAYHMLIRTERRTYHARIAECLAARFPEMRDNEPELLALHYTRAGMNAAAIPLWLAAGVRAHRRSASREAVAQLQQGLQLVSEMPAGDERDQAELEFQIALGPAMMAVKGYAAPAVEATYQRAQDLCERMGDAPRLVPVLAGLWAYNVVGARLTQAQGLAQRLLSLGNKLGNGDILLESHVFLGVTELYLGELQDAKDHLGLAIDAYDPAAHGMHAFVYGQDPRASARVHLADVLWLQGHFAEAIAQADQAIADAEAVKHPHSLAFALCLAARMAVRHRDAPRAKRLGLQAMQVADRYGFPLWGILARIIQGWADAHLGQYESGLAQLEAAMAKYRAIGTRLSRAYYMGLMAELYADRGSWTQAEALIDEALQECRDGDRVAEAEISRLKGEIVLGKDPDQAGPEAEEWLRKALEQSRASGARAWALRAAASLGRRLASSGRAEEARQTASEALASFAADEQGPDLDACRDLLAQLAT